MEIKPVESCHNCGSPNFSVIRDMSSRRKCICGNEWPCPPLELKVPPRPRDEAQEAKDAISSLLDSYMISEEQLKSENLQLRTALQAATAIIEKRVELGRVKAAFDVAIQQEHGEGAHEHGYWMRFKARVGLVLNVDGV